MQASSAARRIDFPFSDPDRYRGILSNILDPVRGFARLGKKKKTAAMHHKPGFDLSRQARLSPGRGQIKHLPIGNLLDM